MANIFRSMKRRKNKSKKSANPSYLDHVNSIYFEQNTWTNPPLGNQVEILVERLGHHVFEIEAQEKGKDAHPGSNKVLFSGFKLPYPSLFLRCIFKSSPQIYLMLSRGKNDETVIVMIRQAVEAPEFIHAVFYKDSLQYVVGSTAYKVTVDADNPGNRSIGRKEREWLEDFIPKALMRFAIMIFKDTWPVKSQTNRTSNIQYLAVAPDNGDAVDSPHITYINKHKSRESSEGSSIGTTGKQVEPHDRMAFKRYLRHPKYGKAVNWKVSYDHCNRAYYQEVDIEEMKIKGGATKPQTYKRR